MGEGHRAAWRNAGDTFRPRNLLHPCLLILLEEAPGYGYELHQRLESVLDNRPEMAAIYRALNGLEEDGLVRSGWERSATGPERRRYSITEAGRGAMLHWARELAQISGLLLRILRRYECGVETTARIRPADVLPEEELFWVRRMLGSWELGPAPGG